MDKLFSDKKSNLNVIIQNGKIAENIHNKLNIYNINLEH